MPKDKDTQEENNKEYADGYGDGRSGNFIKDTVVHNFYDRDSQWVKGYEAGQDDRGEHGSKDKDDCGTGESKSSGGCFLTTACVEAQGLPDDCDYLNVLRSFRDTYVSAHPNGSSLIQEYYTAAPAIVEAINKSHNSGNEWNHVYQEITEITSLINAGNSQGAMAKYRDMFFRLKATYAS